MKQKMIQFLCALAILVLFGIGKSINPAPVLAGGTVTDCGNDTQFSNMLSSGGTITFNCGTATIVLASSKTISLNTTIDGGGKITLSGGDARRLFRVNSNVSFTLNNLTLTNGYSASDNGGALYNGGGTVTLTNSTVKNSKTASNYDGGAFYNTGTLNLTNVTLSENSTTYDNGGAIYNSNGTLNLNTVTLSNNAAGGTGGGIYQYTGTANLANVTFTGNSGDFGGGMYNAGTVTMTNVNFSSNTAENGGGGMYTDDDGIVSFTDVLFYKNTTEQLGGALRVWSSTMTANRVTFDQNTADEDGGAIYNRGGQFNWQNIKFSSNTSKGDGGAISTYYGFSMSNATFQNNHSDKSGGAFYNQVGTVNLTNVTISGNSANEAGGAMYLWAGRTTLLNVTLHGNSAGDVGGGIFTDNVSPDLSLQNVILSSNSGGNCQFNTAPTSSITNLSSDSSCAFGVGRDNVNLLLGALADNGGFTQTHLPQSGSPAINNGTNVECPSTDQRGINRPQGGTCEVGSVEIPEACNTKPTAPKLTKPKNGGTNKKAKVKLDWNDSNCAARYEVIVRQGSTSGAKVAENKNLTASQFKTQSLPRGKIYYWQAKACNNKGCKTSAWWSFRVQ